MQRESALSNPYPFDSRDPNSVRFQTRNGIGYLVYFLPCPDFFDDYPEFSARQVSKEFSGGTAFEANADEGCASIDAIAAIAAATRKAVSIILVTSNAGITVRPPILLSYEVSVDNAER